MPKRAPQYGGGPRRQRVEQDDTVLSNDATEVETIDYAHKNVRDNPAMQLAFEDEYQIKWEDGNARTKLDFALGFAAALRAQRMPTEVHIGEDRHDYSRMKREHAAKSGTPIGLIWPDGHGKHVFTDIDSTVTLDSLATATQVFLAPPPVGRVGEAEVMQLRQMLTYAYCGSNFYGDDGELQDNRMFPMIDFRRDSLDLIERKMYERSMAKLSDLMRLNPTALMLDTIMQRAPSVHEAWALYRQRDDENDGKEYFMCALHHNGTLPSEGERIVKGWFVETDVEGAPSGTADTDCTEG